MLPHFFSGKIVGGTGHGKELGFPTANFEEDVVKKAADQLKAGIYCGWASVDNGPVYKMVMFFGCAPFFKCTKMSMETHILHAVETDLRGHLLKVCMVEYLRAGSNFNSVEELMDQIRSDIKNAEATLDSPSFSKYSKDSFFAAPEK